MNILKLYKDFHLDFRTEGHKHTRPGWVQVECPFCSGNPGYHLGYCIDPKSSFYNRFVCWRCGGKKTLEAIPVLLKVDFDRAKEILRAYGGSIPSVQTKKDRPPRPKKRVGLPPNCLPITEVKGAIAYLKKRRFDPEEISNKWGVLATGPGSWVRTPERLINYSYRLVVPIHYHNRLVTYQCRDWTGKQEPKYLACPGELESVPHKDILYGLDAAEGMNRCVLVEGVTDVWRLGPGAVACFGVKYRPPQVRELINRFKTVVLAFDPDPAGKLQARKIINELKQWKVQVIKAELPKGKDPADLNDQEVEVIRRL